MLDRIKEPYSDAAAEQSAKGGHVHNPDRRRFSRTALASGAVLLSLGNRSAWGGQVGCMSIMTLNSFNPDTQMFASYHAHAARPEHDKELAGQIHDVGDPALDFKNGVGKTTVDGFTGEFRTCEDQTYSNRVCLYPAADDCP